MLVSSLHLHCACCVCIMFSTLIPPLKQRLCDKQVTMSYGVGEGRCCSAHLACRPGSHFMSLTFALFKFAGPVPHFTNVLFIPQWGQLLLSAGAQGLHRSQSDTFFAVPSFPWTLSFSRVRS